MYYVYIIQSALDLSFYIGQTQDIESRLFEHNMNKNKYTSRKQP